jgi:hypothetical protein
MKRKRRHGKVCTGPTSHGSYCRPGRPACRWQRRIKGICTCTAYHFPHRDKSGACRLGMPAKLLPRLLELEAEAVELACNRNGRKRARQARENTLSL